MNIQKTKLSSKEPAENDVCYCDTTFGMAEMLSSQQKHKYLRRMFSGEVRNRGKVAVEHRIQCAWMKYHALQYTFEDKHIPLELRLKLFRAAITATAVYSLETCP